MLRAFALSCVLLFPASLAAADTTTKLALAVAGEPENTGLRVQVRLIAKERDADPAAASQVIDTFAPGTVELALEPRNWTLTAEAEGYWSQTVALELSGSDSPIPIKLWPTGMLSGALRSPDREELPQTIELLFRSIPGIEQPNRISGDWILCPATEGAWRCALPAGLLDVQVAAAGFIKQFFWDVGIKAGDNTGLGTVEMRRGASVRGWVMTADGTPVEGARIKLSPRTAGSSPDPAVTARIEDLATSVTANHRGFFQLFGMKPGDYLLVAEKESFAPARTTVQVLEDEATVIARPPLTLFPPSTLEVYVDPPAPPGSESSLWKVGLVQYDSDHHRIATFAEESIPADGAWRLERVPVGFFSLTLATDDGERWLTQSLEVGPDTGPHFITIPVVEVRGSVRMGSQALEAQLSFGGKYGSQRIYLITDGEGEFVGRLPRAGMWEILVEVDDPPIRREMQQEVEEGEPLDLVFPDTVVHGVVVDEAGEAVRRAIVRVRNVEQIQMNADLRTGDDGRFESVGLPTGRTVLMAEAFEQTSALYELELEEDREPPEVRLVVRRNAMLEGQVVSEAGSGVPGAKLTAMSVESLSMGGPILGTDADGRFETELPAGSRNVVLTVAAPGFALRVLQAPVGEDPLVVPVSHAGGTLTLELPESLDLRHWDHHRPVIFHGGGLISIFALREWASFHGQMAQSENRYVIPQLEPGRYAACLAPLDAFRPLLAGANPGVPCVAGDLPFSGELTLSLRGIAE